MKSGAAAAECRWQDVRGGKYGRDLGGGMQGQYTGEACQVGMRVALCGGQDAGCGWRLVSAAVCVTTTFRTGPKEISDHRLVHQKVAQTLSLSDV